MKKLGPYLLGPNDTKENGIYCGDARELLPQIPDNSIDLVVTSPPYNLGSRYANQSNGAIQGKWSKVIQYDDYKDNLPENEYRQWQQETILELWRIIKSTGAIFYNHRPRIQDGECWHRFDLIPDGVCLRQVIIWKRPKGHNFNRGYFVPSYEWIFLIAKPQYQLKPNRSGFGDVWEFSPQNGSDHPAPFPLDLPLRAITASDNCEIVFDPFMGEGTTAKAAKMEGKHILGFELIPRWAEHSRGIVENTTPLLFVPQPHQIKMALNR
jgi:modification methylase